MSESTTPSAIDAAAGVATVVTAAVALFLLGQGQSDRRRIHRDEQRRQASQVTLSVVSSWTKLDENTETPNWFRLVVLNESDQVIHLNAVTLVEPSTWARLQEIGRTRLRTEDVRVAEHLIRPRTEVTLDLPDGWVIQSGVEGADFIIINFTDARGNDWERRSDTYHLRPVPEPINSAQRLFQTITRRAKPLHWLLAELPARAAIHRARTHPDRIPLALRWCRATHGYWGPGEEDRWLSPDEAPPLWPYTDLPPESASPGS